MQVVQHITSRIRLSRNNISETGRTCTERKNNLKSIKHRAQIMEAKYFCILAFKHETDYNGSISQTKDVAWQGHPQEN